MYSDILENELKPIVESLDKILILKDELFTGDKVALVSSYVSALFTQEIKENMINSYIETFKKQDFTKEDAVEARDILIGAIQEYIDEKNITNVNKKQILDVIIDSLIDSSNAAIERYFDLNKSVKVLFELMHENAKIPTYAHNTDAGADIYLPEIVTIPAAARSFMVHTGLKAVIPNGWEIQIRPRSGISSKTPLRISNAPGTIDAGYRGEICILFDNLSGAEWTLNSGDRIAQMVLAPVTHIDGVKIDSVENYQSERAEGGFGSSGN